MRLASFPLAVPRYTAAAGVITPMRLASGNGSWPMETLFRFADGSLSGRSGKQLFFAGDDEAGCRKREREGIF